MTIWLALTLAQATETPLAQVAETPLPSATAEEEREILVIGRKSAWWRGRWMEKDGVASCTTETSTGDVAIDTIMCDGLSGCFPRYLPEMKSIVEGRQAAGKPVTRENLDKLMKPAMEKIKHCTQASTRKPVLAMIRARKAAHK